MGKLLACIKDAISFNLPPFLRFLCFGPDYGSIWESASVNVAGGWPLGVGSLATQSPWMCHQCYSPGESQLAPAPLLSFSLFLSVSLRFSPFLSPSLPVFPLLSSPLRPLEALWRIVPSKNSGVRSENLRSLYRYWGSVQSARILQECFATLTWNLCWRNTLNGIEYSYLNVFVGFDIRGIRYSWDSRDSWDSWDSWDSRDPRRRTLINSTNWIGPLIRLLLALLLISLQNKMKRKIAAIWCGNFL